MNAKFISPDEFAALPTYQLSEPTGVYHNGRLMKFKRRYGWVWYEIEYVEIGKPDRVGVTYTPLVLCLD